MPKRMIINAFDLPSVGHSCWGQWRAPGSQDANYKSIHYWTELAKIAERGKFDAVFIADILGVHDTYAGSADLTLRGGVSTPSVDPTYAIAAMAAATENVGLGVTVSTTYEEPYMLARRLTTLDHFTNGRLGWNIVTSFVRSAAVNLGKDNDVPHDERYDIADEFMDVTYKLWEGSWEDGAVVADPETGDFVDPQKVHPIAHEGKYFKVPGIHMSEPSPQRTPFLYQAGASEKGKQFAARHAEAVFLSGGGVTPEQIRKTTDDIRDKAEAAGRPRDSIKIIAHVTVVSAESDDAAQRKLEKQRETAHFAAAAAYLSSVTGVDFSAYDPDEPLKYVKSNAIQFILAGFTTMDSTREWTLRQVLEYMEIGAFSPVIVGGPKTVADELERWMDVGGIDGYNLGRVVSHETMTDFVEHIVPELQRRGRMWTDYPKGQDTLRGRTFGTPHVADWHPASSFRGAYVNATSAAQTAEAGALVS